jgi:hypothetical protein
MSKIRVNTPSGIYVQQNQPSDRKYLNLFGYHLAVIQPVGIKRNSLQFRKIYNDISSTFKKIGDDQSYTAVSVTGWAGVL